MLSDFLPKGTILLISAHTDNKVFSYVDNTWSQVLIPQARGIAIGKYMAIAGGTEIVHFRSDGSRAVTIHIPNVHTHEAVYDANDELWVAASQNSALVTFDMFGVMTEKWRVPGVDASTDNRSQVNGVALKEGVPTYVTALGVSNQPNGWRAEAGTEGGALIDITANEVVLHDLFMPHSPRWHDGKVWFLNSGHGELCTWTPGEITRQVVAKVTGFSRGLLLTDTHALVGVSQGRTTAFPNLTTDPLAQPGIAVIDLATGEQVYFESMDIQEVFDIQIGLARLEDA